MKSTLYKAWTPPEGQKFPATIAFPMKRLVVVSVGLAALMVGVVLAWYSSPGARVPAADRRR